MSCRSLGGTGRVGSSTAAVLLRSEPGLDVALASRSEASFRSLVKKRPELAAARFVRCDIDDDADLSAALQGVDLVVHTAGYGSSAPVACCGISQDCTALLVTSSAPTAVTTNCFAAS